MKNKKESYIAETADKVVLYFLSGIWLMILFFGIITLMQPKWLVEISKPGRLTEATEYLDEGIKLLYEARKTGDLDMNLKAAEAFQNALRIDTANFYALGNLGIAYQNMGKFTEAMKIFRYCLAMDTASRYQTCIYIADLYDQNKIADSALHYYSKAIAENIEPAYPLRKSGVLLMKMKKFDESYKLISKAIVAEQSFIQFYHNQLTKTYLNLLQTKDSLKAGRLHDKIVAADYARDIQRFDQEIFETENNNNEGLGFCYFYLGDLYALRGITDSATLYYNLCVQYNPRLHSSVRERTGNQ